MNSETYEELIDPKLWNAFIELSKDDVILSQVLKNSDSEGKFINSLLACIICLVSREKEAQQIILKVLKANPEVQKILKMKNEM